jgi:hypothetical protein
MRGISWGVVPLVAGLFVLVQGLNNTGVVAQLTEPLKWGVSQSVTGASWISGAGLAFVTNLPAGLIAESAVTPAHPLSMVTGALLIGVDLGPNLSVTGSLATILWLIAQEAGGRNLFGCSVPENWRGSDAARAFARARRAHPHKRSLTASVGKKRCSTDVTAHPQRVLDNGRGLIDTGIPG